MSTQTQTARWWRADNAPAGVYGTIISASVLAAAHEDTALEIGLGVFFTLLVYWLAERWSELLGSHLQGEPFDWVHVRRVFVRGWPMVQASYLPVLVLVAARLLGASVEEAVNIALFMTIVVLIGLGILAARRAGLPPVGVAASAVFNGFLGVLLILLKSFAALSEPLEAGVRVDECGSATNGYSAHSGCVSSHPSASGWIRPIHCGSIGPDRWSIGRQRNG